MAYKKLMACAGVVLAAVAIAVSGAFACTILPAGNISQAYGPPGKAVVFTGSAWDPVFGPVSLRWNAVNGPVLAQVNPDPSGMIPPTSFLVPSSAEPGYHFISASQSPTGAEVNGGGAYGGQGAPDLSIRLPFQVTTTNRALAPPPQVVLPGGAPATNPSSVGAATIGLLAAAGLAGLMLFGAGTATLVRSQQRTPVAARADRRR